MQMTSTILLDDADPSGPAFLEVFEDGSAMAGASRQLATRYETVDSCHTLFKEKSLRQYSSISHPSTRAITALSICLKLEDYMTQRDEGR